MGIDVVQGQTQFRVEQPQVAGFEAVFNEQLLNDYWELIKDESGTITHLALVGDCGKPCEFSQMEALARS